jgi:methylphosphotriester-DNA--protein-cysteine methyltransferase
MKYITTKRLGLVRQEMLNGIKAGEAAYRAGFNDYTTFYRAYNSFYGSAPSKLLASDVKIAI